jgi:hypothetical protein
MTWKAEAYLLAVALLALALGGLMAHAAIAGRGRDDPGRLPARLVRALGLTDLALFPETRYTRHPAVADRFSAFQDHPLALEHFPTGSLIPPPPALRGNGD